MSLKIYEQNGIKYTQGKAIPYGPTLLPNKAVNFSLNSAHATSCTLVLFQKGAQKPFIEIKLPASFRTGDNFAITVLNLEPETIEYGFRLDGPYDKAKGLLFDSKKILMDPYGKAVTGHDTWGTFDYPSSDYKLRSCLPSAAEYDWEDDVPLHRPLQDAIIYEAHVRSFTKHASSKVTAPGTYGGIIEKIPYLKELGINTIELLPIFDFNEREFDNQPEKKILNMWGYSPISFFAPKNSYCTVIDKETKITLKDLVKVLHQNGIEVILDVVYNHTTEAAVNGKGKHAIYSFRGIDGPTYYMLCNDGSDMNLSGCFNTLNCAHPTVSSLILDSLRYWVTEYHVDGFRFDLAPILSYGTDGQPQKRPPLLEAIADDPILAHTKLIAEPWDAVGLYQLGTFPGPKRWQEWNDRYRNTLRGYLRGEALAGKDLIKRMQGSPDVFAQHKNSADKDATASINFVTCHDGFTLMDLFSYKEKHNLSNGDQNRDGSDWNISQNCGIEGPTYDPVIMRQRKQGIKNALTILLTSRGVPMLLAGDEFGNSQQGNNNSFCQDNAIGWLNWNNIEQHSDILQLVQKMTKLRKEHPVLRKASYENETTRYSFPELSFHGTIINDIHLDQPMLTFAALYVETKEQYEVAEDCFIYVGMNQYEKAQHMELPALPKGWRWYKYIDTTASTYEEAAIKTTYYDLATKAVVVLIAKKEEQHEKLSCL